MHVDRRSFIRFIVSGPILGGCPISAGAAEAKRSVAGETFAVCHRVRDGDDFPKATARRSHDLVIVGGGICGLTAAHLLRDRDVLILEKEPIWGGNARLQEHGEMACSIGSAFIGLTDTAGKLAKELGIQPLPIKNWDGTIDNGIFTPDTWGEGLDSLPYPREVRQQFKALRSYVLGLDLEKEGDRFDDVSVEKMITPYGPEVMKWWNAFCPSNWGGRIGETSASLAIEELRWMGGVDRTDTRATWPGGVGFLSRRLSELVRARLTDRMIDRATVISIKSERDRVSLTYLRGETVTTVEAKGAIIATPQYITSRLVAGLPSDQLKAMQQIQHVPYCVVNLIFDRQVLRVGYDTWCPGRRFTDVISADWVEGNRPAKSAPSILTCYVPLSAADRESLLSEDWCRKLAGEVLSSFQSMMPGLDVDPVEVHIYRRGHAIHTSLPGLSGHQKLARQPVGRISFANTDLESLGATTSSAILSARRAVKEIERFI